MARLQAQAQKGPSRHFTEVALRGRMRWRCVYYVVSGFSRTSTRSVSRTSRGPPKGGHYTEAQSGHYTEAQNSLQTQTAPSATDDVR
jgi:hypothetical protein